MQNKIIRIFHNLALAGTFLLSYPVSMVHAEKQLVSISKELEKIRQTIMHTAPHLENLTKETSLLVHESNEIKEKLLATARDIRSDEKKLNDLEIRLTKFHKQEKELLSIMQNYQEEMGDLFSAMARLSLAPRTPLGTTHDPLQTMQSAILLKGLKEELNYQANQIKHNLMILSQTRLRLETQRQNAQQRQITLQHKKKELKQLLAVRADAFQEKQIQRLDTEQRLALLRQEKDKLETRQYIAQRYQDHQRNQSQRLEQVRLASLDLRMLGELTPLSSKPIQPNLNRSQGTRLLSDAEFSRQRGQLLIPVSTGKIAIKFGQKNEHITSKGIVIKPRAGSLITAPTNGRITFAGTMKYGKQAIIIRPSPSYHVIIVGAMTLNVKKDQTIHAGEPIGMLTTKQTSNSLYIEIIKGQRHLDPSDWFMT